jgi:hypothetical protein
LAGEEGWREYGNAINDEMNMETIAATSRICRALPSVVAIIRLRVPKTMESHEQNGETDK